MFSREYVYDLTRHFKIWFSKNPDEPLGAENALRLIRWREKNPKLTLTLIYSSLCLNEGARGQLTMFCEKHRLQCIDVDRDLRPHLTDDRDISIYELAGLELKHAREKTGGNLAAASDLVRLILYVLHTYGIYSDLDVELQFTKPIQDKFVAYTPLILLDSKTEYDPVERRYGRTEVNNSVVMAPQAVMTNPFWQALQNFVIDRYRFSGDNNKESERYNFIEPMVSLRENNEPYTSIFECRRELENYLHHPEELVVNDEESAKGLTQDDIIVMLNSVYMEMVMEVSGPSMIRAFIQYLQCRQYQKRYHAPMSELSELVLDKYKQSVADKIARLHPKDIDAVLALKTATHVRPDADQFGDLSWTLFGAAGKGERDEKITAAARVIQKAWRKHHR